MTTRVRSNQAAEMKALYDASLNTKHKHVSTRKQTHRHTHLLEAPSLAVEFQTAERSLRSNELAAAATRRAMWLAKAMATAAANHVCCHSGAAERAQGVVTEGVFGEGEEGECLRSWTMADRAGKQAPV